MSESDTIIAAYLAAYGQANGAKPPFRLVYEKGWVRFYSKNSSWVMDRKRLGHLVSMAETLQRRAADRLAS
ncbi:UNVERIFIED_ORG: hypothetical protein J2W74_003424 [Methylorubrum zatmanii]